MAAIRRKRGQIAVACSASVLFCNTGDYKGWQKVELPEVKRDDKEEVEEEENKQTSNEGNRVLALAFSPTGQYAAVCDDRKQLHVYTRGEDWALVSSRNVVRRGKSLVFTQDETTILLADKSGDIYSFDVRESDKAGELTHGHLSMVLDMVLASDDSYVVTCDRDEKVRITNYPNSYNIHSFCLGHKEFVTSLVFSEKDNILVSGSGDLSIKTWTLEGKQLDSIQTAISAKSDLENASDLDQRPAIQKLSYCAKHRILATSFFGYNNIELYMVSEGGKLSLLHTLSLHTQPWDMCLDEDGYLWVLQPKEANTLDVYHVTVEGESCKVSVVTGDDGPLNQARKDLNLKWDVIKECLHIKSMIPMLWKQRIDNMADYMKRKEERLAGKAGGDNSSGKDSPPPKLPKTSS